MVKNGKLVYSKPLGRGNLDLGAIRGLGFNYDDGLNSFMGSYKPGMLRFQYNRRF